MGCLFSSEPSDPKKPITVVGGDDGASGAIKFKVAVIGPHGVGKTSLVKCMLGSRLGDVVPIPTLAVDFGSLEVDVRNADGEPTRAQLEIWDFAGDERYMSSTRQQFRGKDALLVCMDLTDRDSTPSANPYWSSMVAENCGAALVQLVGCKADLVPAHRERAVAAAASSGADEGHLSVEDAWQEADELARYQALELGDGGGTGEASGGSLDRPVAPATKPPSSAGVGRVRFLATSAVSGEGVRRLLQGLAQAMMDRRLVEAGRKDAVDARVLQMLGARPGPR